nr:keratin, type I cytoskeletal 10-like [Penaeus vannamei]
MAVGPRTPKAHRDAFPRGVGSRPPGGSGPEQRGYDGLRRRKGGGGYGGGYGDSGPQIVYLPVNCGPYSAGGGGGGGGGGMISYGAATACPWEGDERPQNQTSKITAKHVRHQGQNHINSFISECIKWGRPSNSRRCRWRLKKHMGLLFDRTSHTKVTVAL